MVRMLGLMIIAFICIFNFSFAQDTNNSIEARSRMTKQDAIATQKSASQNLCLYQEISLFIDDQTKIDFVLIPSGEFDMGGDLDNEKPLHKVKITKAFYMGIYEVTQAQYISVMNKKPTYFLNPNLPVGVTWNEAVEFCNKLTILTGNKFRLPTEAEWEYAARGGIDSKKYIWGDSILPVVDGIKQANVPDESLKKLHPQFNIIKGYNDGFDGLAPVGSFAPNGYGLYDMTGNAWERCSDYYDETYYKSSPVNDPQGPNYGMKRVLRGGGCWYNPDELKVGSRCGSPVNKGGSNDGFRVVMEIK